MRDISPLTVLSFVASLADRAGRDGEVRADCGRGHRPGPGSSVPGRRHHHAVLVLCRERRAVEPQARHHRVQRPTGLPARRRRHLHLRPAAGMHPRRERHFATTPVAEIVAHSVAGSWIKAQRHQRWRSDLLCAATERGTIRTRAVRGDPCRPTLARWRGDRGHRLGRTQQCCFYEGGRRRPVGATQGRSIRLRPLQGT